MDSPTRQPQAVTLQQVEQPRWKKLFAIAKTPYGFVSRFFRLLLRKYFPTPGPRPSATQEISSSDGLPVVDTQPEGESSEGPVEAPLAQENIPSHSRVLQAIQPEEDSLISAEEQPTRQDNTLSHGRLLQPTQPEDGNLIHGEEQPAQENVPSDDQPVHAETQPEGSGDIPAGSANEDEELQRLRSEYARLLGINEAQSQPEVEIFLTHQESAIRCSMMTAADLRGRLEPLNIMKLTPDHSQGTDDAILQFFVDKRHSFGAACAWATACKRMSRNPLVRPGEITLDKYDEALVSTKVAEDGWVDIYWEDDSNGEVLGRYSTQATYHPRRLWDLCANRVIPFAWLDAMMGFGRIWTISHAWTADMVPTWTHVNEFQWPVPLPRGVCLEQVRLEMLQLGAKFCWLDVLCLRQSANLERNADGARTLAFQRGLARSYLETGREVAPRLWEHLANVELIEESLSPAIVAKITEGVEELQASEALRLVEWKVDVPTIGNVYDKALFVIVYFNGLGRPFQQYRQKCRWRG